MKYVRYFIIMYVLTFLLQSCGFSDWEVTELYAQKIEGTPKVLYKYDAWGGLDANASGYVILDSSETFKVKIRNDLPFMYLQEIPDKTIIKGVSHICDSSCGENYNKVTPIFVPVKKEKTESQNIKIVNNIYQYKGFSERTKLLETLQFEKFRETRDSLFFYNLDDVESVNGKHLDSLKFKKKDITIRQTKAQKIINITVEDLVVNQNSNEIILCQTYFLTPKEKLNSTLFSDYGIFKEVIK